MNTQYDIIILGGGAAGFFTAINIAQQNNKLSIAILERGKEVLTKVKVSGGGRCNVTHAEFLPNELSKNYPRGEKELLGPFHTFMTGDTINWFEERGIPLKIEDDGRMFPITDSSKTIIDCFISETSRHGISVLTGHAVKSINKVDDLWKLESKSETFSAEKIVIATGSNTKVWNLLKILGHTIIEPVPSLFTFNIKDERIVELPGLVTQASVRVISEKSKIVLESEGPLLITHWGMSGPAILKLSAWGARILEKMNYTFIIEVNWLEYTSKEEALDNLLRLKTKNAKQTIYKYPQFDVPKRLWRSLLKSAFVDPDQTWAAITKKELVRFADELTASTFKVEGKSTFKEEFVTAGGVDLKEVNFKTFESKIHKDLYLAGEVLNIDAITGGFNFQNAWTSGFMVSKAITS